MRMMRLTARRKRRGRAGSSTVPRAEVDDRGQVPALSQRARGGDGVPGVADVLPHLSQSGNLSGR